MSSQKSEDEDTDTKLAILASLFPDADPAAVFEILIEADGNVETASERLQSASKSPDRRDEERNNHGEYLRPRLEPDVEPVTTLTGQSGWSLPPAPKRQKLSAVASANASRSQSISSSLGTIAPIAPSASTQQQSIRRYHAGPVPLGPVRGLSARKGQTLHLWDGESIAATTPCSIIHNFLPAGQADALLRELLAESTSFGRASFKLFERTVSSPHTSCFYVGSAAAQAAQTREYVYNGSYLTDVRRLTPQLEQAAPAVEDAVNREIARRIAGWYPDAKKLRFQSPLRWRPNCAFVNCYDGPQESVGAHADQLTYVGPRAVIGSLSLGVEREFRVRRIVPKEDPVIPDEANEKDAKSERIEEDKLGAGTFEEATEDTKTGSKPRDFFLSPRKRKLPGNETSPSKPSPSSSSSTGTIPPSDDEGGQIAIHLPHNSLLIMHAEMQEEWKHAIAPAATVTPHPVAGARRINITYRWYRPEFHPRHTPRCACNVPAVLRCVQRRAANHGRYMWMCHVNYTPGKEGCGFFKWAEFDDDGRPEWAWGEKGDTEEEDGDGKVEETTT